MFEEKILKWLNEEMTQQELKSFEALLAANPEMAAEANAYKAILGVDVEIVPLDVDVEHAWSKFEQKEIGDVATVKRMRPMRWVASIAAVFLIGLVSVYAIKQSGPSWETVSAEAGKMRTVELADGSIVTLKDGATLEFPKKFGKQVREVTMSGQAFFQVEGDQNWPFVISGDDLEVTVLGTAFEVIDPAGPGLATVSVMSGEVQVKQYATGEILTIKPQMKLVSEGPGDDLDVELAESPNRFSWVTQELSFDGTSIDEVIQDVATYFSVSISNALIDKTACTFSGTFPNPRFAEVSETLETALGIQVEKTGDRTYAITGSRCNK